MAQCFCGCGRRVKFLRGADNKSGKKLDASLRLWRKYAQAFDEADYFTSFLRDGEVGRDVLAGYIHGERDLSSDFRNWVGHWLFHAEIQAARLAGELRMDSARAEFRDLAYGSAHSLRPEEPPPLSNFRFESISGYILRPREIFDSDEDYDAGNAAFNAKIKRMQEGIAQAKRG